MEDTGDVYDAFTGVDPVEDEMVADAKAVVSAFTPRRYRNRTVPRGVGGQGADGRLQVIQQPLGRGRIAQGP
jgi:hypothetical protein